MSREYSLDGAISLCVSTEHGGNSNNGKIAESTLVGAAKANPEAFGEIYTRYVGRVYKYLRARTGNEENAADLTQQVFLQALNALPKYQERGLPLAAWLFRISRNVANDAHRRRGGTPALSWESLPQSLHPADPHNYEQEVLRHEQLQEDLHRIKALLQSLKPEQRELIALRFFAELTLSEIAKVVGRSQGTVQRQMVRVLQILKEQYNEE